MKKSQISLVKLSYYLVMFTVIVVTLIYFFLVRPQITTLKIDEIHSENEQIAYGSKLYIESMFDEQILLIASIANTNESLFPNNVVTNDDFYQEFINQSDMLESIEVIDTSGNILYSTLIHENRIGLNIQNNPLFLQLEEPASYSIGSLKYSSNINELTLDIFYRLDNIIVKGEVSIHTIVKYFNELSTVFKNREFILLNEYQIYIYQSEDNLHLIQAQFLEINRLTDASNITTLYDSKVILASNQISFVPWVLVVYEPTTTALQSLNIINTYFVTTLTTISGIFIFLFLYFNHKHIKSLNNLSESMKEFGINLVNKPMIKETFKEFSIIGDHFSAMKDKIINLNNSISRIAYFDDLTKLGNKNAAKMEFDHMKMQSNVAFVYLDIQGFSVFNDRYGYAIGDKALLNIVGIIQQYFMHVFRIEGDEFVLLQSYEKIEEFDSLVMGLTKQLRDGFVIERIRFEIQINMGVAIYPLDGNSFLDLMRKSSISAKKAKAIQGTNISFYKKEDEISYIRKMDIEIALIDAFINGEFNTHFQPIMDVKTMKIRGFEALTRWHNARLGQIRPDEFIPILERTKRIHMLDKKVLNDALRFNKYAISQFNHQFVVSVNISVETLLRNDFTKMVDDALDSFEYDPWLLEIEITESSIIYDFDKIKEVMMYLRNKGVKFSEDDFGDAYSSLSYLSRINLDTLKISRNFLQQIHTNIESRVLVQTIIDLSKKLGFKTVIEGIEDEITLRLFKQYNCDYAQGYHFYKPMPEADLIRILENLKLEESNEKTDSH